MAVDMVVSVAGVTFKNPVLAAPGPPTSTLDHLRRAVEAGCGGVVVKTAVADSLAEMRLQARPRFHLLDWDKRLGNSIFFTLYSLDQAFHGSIDDYVTLLHAAVREFPVPVVGSILAGEPEEWSEMAAQVAGTGIAGLELDLSCPHSLDEAATRQLGRVVEAVASSVTVPVVAKLPQRADTVQLARAVLTAGATAVTLCNRSQGLDIDVENARPVAPGALAGHGGPWAKYAVLAQVAEVYRELEIPISASGGVLSGIDAAKYLLAGARTVQICSGIIINGYRLIEHVVRELAAYLEERGYASPAEAVGVAAKKLVLSDGIRRGGKGHAVIDPTRCTNCGRCLKVCFYGAIVAGEDGYLVHSEHCDGCGLCAQPGVCRWGAIRFISEIQ